MLSVTVLLVFNAFSLDTTQQCGVCRCLSTGHQSNVDVIVADKHISSATLALAEQQHIPVVSSEWVVQCLIAGRRLSVTGHAKYMHSAAE